tara:strand:- start:134 stop:658 length:525 start_codon:yes stop_codon:yes gene_type:complete
MAKKKKEEEKEEDGGTSLDDAFGDDDDVEYAPSKPRKPKKKKKSTTFEKGSRSPKGEGDDEEVEEELEEELEEVEEAVASKGANVGKIKIKGKNIGKLKKGDKIKVDGVEMEVDAHVVLMDHGKNKEMALEVFNPKTDMDYQLRYFDDRIEESAEFFELDEILYQRKEVKKIEF